MYLALKAGMKLSIKYKVTGQGAMVKWLDWSLEEQENMDLIPAPSKGFSLLGHKVVGKIENLMS